MAAIIPITTIADIVYAGTTTTLARLGIGSSGDVLTVSGGLPAWAAPPGAGGLTTGQSAVDFGSGSDTASLVVAAGTVLAGSRIYAIMSYDPVGARDRDELEMDSFEVKVGNIVAGVSFTLFVTCLTGYGEGQYYVHWGF